MSPLVTVVRFWLRYRPSLVASSEMSASSSSGRNARDGDGSHEREGTPTKRDKEECGFCHSHSHSLSLSLSRSVGTGPRLGVFRIQRSRFSLVSYEVLCCFCNDLCVVGSVYSTYDTSSSRFGSNCPTVTVRQPTHERY